MQKYQFCSFKNVLFFFLGITEEGACVSLNQSWLLLSPIRKLREYPCPEALVFP